MLKQVECGEIPEKDFMEGIEDMSRALVREHTAPEERFTGLFPDAKGNGREAVGTCPAAAAPCTKGKKDSSVRTGTVPSHSGKITNSFPVRKRVLPSLWQRPF